MLPEPRIVYSMMRGLAVRLGATISRTLSCGWLRVARERQAASPALVSRKLAAGLWRPSFESIQRDGDQVPVLAVEMEEVRDGKVVRGESFEIDLEATG